MIGVPSSHGRRGPLRPLSVAPMVDRTDRHFRRIVRLVSRHTLLYTEMVVARAVVAGRAGSRLDFDPIERPLAVQLAGDDPAVLAEAASRCEALGFDEIDLNCGCPSRAAVAGGYGAVLMRAPQRVAQSVAAMRAACRLPITVKHRLGVDENLDVLHTFVATVAAAGCDRFIVHGRMARLGGLSPQANREVPRLRLECVAALKRSRPELAIEWNGGLRSLTDACASLRHVDGAMIGRAVYDDPMVLANADRLMFGSADPPVRRAAVLAELRELARAWVDRGGRLHSLTRHAYGLLTGIPGARAARGLLAAAGPNAGPSIAVLDAALAKLANPGEPVFEPASDVTGVEICQAVAEREVFGAASGVCDLR